MNVLFVTDPLPGLEADVDATVGLMTAAQELGSSVWVCEPKALSVVQGSVRCSARRIRVMEGRRNGSHRWVVEDTWWHDLEQRTLEVATDTQLVHVRIDPPVNGRYLHTTYLLDLVDAAGVRVINRPSGIRALHEKLGALAFPELCPETVVSADPAIIRAFVAKVRRAVIKPVDGFAGAGVWLVSDDRSAAALVESATGSGSRHVIVQRYLDEVEFGNKRLFVLDGEIIGGVLRRPEPDDFRIGPPAALAEIDQGDVAIVQAIAPVLATHGIHLAGLDVIAGRLIEINVTCPGGMRKADALLGTDLSGVIMRHLLDLERV